MLFSKGAITCAPTIADSFWKSILIAGSKLIVLARGDLAVGERYVLDLLFLGKLQATNELRRVRCERGDDKRHEKRLPMRMRLSWSA